MNTKNMKKSKKFIASAAATGGLVTSLILSKPASTLATDTYQDRSMYSIDVNDSLDNDSLSDFEESLYAQGLTSAQVHSLINSAPSDTKMKSKKIR
jgi:hypothetical protein